MGSEELYRAAGLNERNVAPSARIKTLAEVEREYIEHVLALCAGRIQDAAIVLGVSASTLYRKHARWNG